MQSDLTKEDLVALGLQVVGRRHAATRRREAVRRSMRLAAPCRCVLVNSDLDRMLHHISLAVADLERAGVFYDTALAGLRYRRVFEDATAIGYGVEDGEDKFCIKLGQVLVRQIPGFT